LSEFIDQLRLRIKAGDGGNGCVSFRREKYVPRGGPDGGNGGRGGHIIFKATSALSTLSHIRANSLIRAGRGGHGSGKNKTGAAGSDELLRVPVGTIVRDATTGELIADLGHDSEEVIVAHGGRGGLGNAAFAGPQNRTPRRAMPGEKGEERLIELELKLLADVGIIGLPNSGKSTLTARISAARPKVADYPFTTLVPVLGVVEAGESSFVVADIPGLVEGAHEGTGLGHKFLRHIERTKVLLHMVDIGGPSADDPVKALKTIDEELSLFLPDLADKPQLVAANKIDLQPPAGRLEQLRAEAEKSGRKCIGISAATGAGVEEMLLELLAMLKEHGRGDEGPGETRIGGVA